MPQSQPNGSSPDAEAAADATPFGGSTSTTREARPDGPTVTETRTIAPTQSDGVVTGAPASTVDDVSAKLNDAEVRDLAAQFEDEKPGRDLGGPVRLGVTVVTFVIALLVLWQAFQPLAQGSQYYLMIFLAGVLPLLFLVYPSGIELPWRRRPVEEEEPHRARRGPTVVDWVLAAVAFVACAYPVLPFTFGDSGGGYDAFLNRQGDLTTIDVLLGAALLVLVIEACRRTTGWVLPVVCLVFLAYDYYGGFLPQSWSVAHAGLDFDQIVDALYNSPSGFYGTPLDVAASYIVLFTIYGAVLDHSGAGAFFVELSVAAFRKSRSAAGRTAVASGFLLGTVSGSGAATTVSIGAVTWPILKRAGYPAERAGGMLAASGVGAILSPPTLGAAAFIIAEYLDVSYLEVLLWATIPTILYYFGILLSVEIDARRFGARAVDIEARSPWKLLGRFGYHFLSLLVIIVLLALGQSATHAVIYATLLAAALSFLDRRHMLTPKRAVEALAGGIRSVLPVVAVCVAAGIITASTTKTGLGPQVAGLIVGWAEALATDKTMIVALSAIFAAIALTLLGLAVPVTASFIIGWVIIGQALINLGVSEEATAMFIFYFAVLSEATPPTALASVAAAAVTGGKVFPTMWQTLRYALPAYLVPIAFVITPAGENLLAIGELPDIGFALACALLGVVGLAVACGGWFPGFGPAKAPERVLAAAGGLILLWLSPLTAGIGVLLLAVVIALVLLRRRSAGPGATPDGVVLEGVTREERP